MKLALSPRLQRAPRAAALSCGVFALALSPIARGQTVFPVLLDEGQVVTPTGSPNKGAGHVFYNPINQTITYDITITGVSGAFLGAHLQRGGPGEEGSVILALVGGPTNFSGISSIGSSDVQLLVNSETYVSVRSGGFPNGEIRGQVTPSRNQLYSRLTGNKVTPPSGSNAMGDLSLKINPNNTVSYDLDLFGLGGPATIAHLHRGGVGEQGPIIHGLSWTSPGIFSGTTAPLSSADLAHLRAGDAYVDVHSAALPNGEVRGQVGTSFTSFLEGCYGQPSGAAQLVGAGTPRPGGDITVAIVNGVPNQGGILFLGAIGGNIPFEWGCRLFVGPPWIPLVLPPLNGNGALSIPAQLPLNSPPGWLQMQYFGEQPSAPGGFYSTNGLSMRLSH